MRTVGWMPAGAQLWHKHIFDSGGTRAAYASTLAIYVYDIASSPPQLEQILVGADKTIRCISWSPHDPNLIAVATAEEVPNVAIWDLECEAEVRRLSTAGQNSATHIQWSVHNPSAIVCASAHGAVSVIDHTSGDAHETQWGSHAHRNWNSVAAQAGTMAKCGGLRLSPRVPSKLAPKLE